MSETKTKDLICFSGRNYEEREYCGIVVDGVWIEEFDVPERLKSRVEKTLLSDEINDAPIETGENEDGFDYYYYLLD